MSSRDYDRAYKAVQEDDSNTLSQIDLSPFINIRSVNTFLGEACQRGHLEIVKFLLNVKNIDYDKGDVSLIVE